MGSKGGAGAVLGGALGIIGGPAGIALGASLGAQLGSTLDSAEAAEDLARRNKQLSAQQAKEVLRQAKIQANGLMREGREFTGNQASAFAAGGVDVGSQSALVVMENTAAQYKRDAYETVRTAATQGKIINRRASARLDAAKSGKRAAIIGSIGRVGMTLASAGAFGKFGGATGSAAGGATGGTSGAGFQKPDMSGTRNIGDIP